MAFIDFFPESERDKLIAATLEDNQAKKISGKIQLINSYLHMYEAQFSDSNNINTNYARYYFLDINKDNKQQLFEKFRNFDFYGMDEIQEIIFSKMFYGIGSDLRWNLYLYFVCEEDEIRRSFKDVYKIQQDTNYSQKNIIIRDEIKYIPVFFDFNKMKKEKDTVELKDIENVWYNELDKIGLGEYLDANQLDHKALNDYLINFQVGKTSRKKKNKTASKKKINKIESLDMNNYRPCFNKEYHIDFCDKINVFYGTNGSGKTGILEAVEMAITGRNNRTPKDSPISGNKAVAVVKSGESLFSSTVDRDERQALDAAWYNSGKAYEEHLNKNFCTFNFFHSNKTQNLLDDKSGEIIESDLTKVLFSKTTLDKEKQIEKLQQFFESKKDDFIIETQKAKTAIEKLTAEMKQYSDLSVARQYFDEFIKAAQDIVINSKLTEIDKIGEEIIKLSNSIHQIEAEYLSESTETLPLLKYAAQNKLTDIETKISQRKKLSEQIQDCSMNGKFLSENLKNINGLKNYYASKDSVYSVDIDEIYSTEIKQLNVLEYLQKQTNEIEFIDGLENLEFSKCLGVKLQEKIELKDLTNTLNALFQNISILNKQIEDIKNTISDNDSVINTLKSLIDKRLSQNPSNNTCPVCGKKFDSQEELLKAINDTFSVGNSLNNTYQQYVQQLQELNMQKKETENKLRIKERKIIMLAKIESISDNARVNLIDFKANNLLQFNDWMYNEIQNKKMNVAQLNSAREYYYLLKTQEISAKNKSELLKTLEAKYEDILAKEKINLSEWKILADSLSKYEPEEILLLTLSNQKIKLHTIIQAHEIAEMVYTKTNFSKSEKLLNIASVIKKALNLYEMGKEYNKNQKIISDINERILTETNRINILEKQLINLDHVLNAIIKLERTAKTGSDFIDGNKEKIEKLFNLIHKPKEFNEMRIVGGKIYFKRQTLTGKKENADPNHMSTGQLISLSLAVMFTLHFSMKKAPRFMMLDEPIANLDDVHFINMLDILRQIAINGTQVFISTANKDIAALMRRKFSVFKKKYGHFVLIREENMPTEIIKKEYEPEKESSKVTIISAEKKAG